MLCASVVNPISRLSVAPLLPWALRNGRVFRLIAENARLSMRRYSLRVWLRQSFYPVDVRQITILLGVIHSVTHDETLGDFEPNVIHRDLDKPTLPLVDEGAHFDGARPEFF